MLEQWEIELRQQLGSIPKKENWERALEKEITPIVHKKRFGSLTAVCAVVFLCVLGMLTVIIGNKYKVSSTSVEKAVETPWCSDLTRIKTALELRISEVHDLAQKTADENNKLTDKIKIIRDHTNVMGIVMNENFVITKNGTNKQDILILGADWTISQMPKNIKMTDEDKTYLQKFVRSR